MEVDDDRLIDTLGSVLRYGGSALADVPELLKRLLETEMWRDFTTVRRQHVTHERFADFVTTPPLAGLGSSVDLVRRIVADDDKAVDLLDKALQRTPADNQPLSNIQEHAPTGTSRAAALRRLRKDRPDLHAEVLAGGLSAHSAAVRAGFRPRTFTVRADDPVRAAAVLRRNYSSEQLAEIARLLLNPEA